MKIRSCFVSNSSSSSFVIHNWFDLSEDTRSFIEDYDNNALSVWSKKNIAYKIDEDTHGYNKDYPFYGEEYYFDYDKNKEKDQKYDFGWLNNDCRWRFTENKVDNNCVVHCFMNNFDMNMWLKYNKVHFSKEEEC